MSDDWRPYDPSRESEASAIYERSGLERSSRRMFSLVLEHWSHDPKNREWFDHVFGALAHRGGR